MWRDSYPSRPTFDLVTADVGPQPCVQPDEGQVLGLSN
jgi:hypothetical protein